MAYDAARQRVVLFGGADSTSLLADTWEWDGNDWTRRTPATSPPARTSLAMAYDIVRQRIVLFGGNNGGSGPLADTWEWDGSDWSRRTPTSSPSARESHAMTYDLARRRILLFGGRVDHLPGRELSDTWEWDGGTWNLRTPANRPTGRHSHAVAYDIVRQIVVLYGGWQNAGVLPSDIMWEWNGSNWSQISPAIHPGRMRTGHAMAYDAVRRHVVLFGGHWGDAQLRQPADTWGWDGTRFVMLAPSSPPAAAGMAYDLVRQRVVVFGRGIDATSPAPETWEWDGRNWTLRTPIHAPFPRGSSEMAYDLARQRVVLFGGQGSTTFFDTWEWDGTNWTHRAPATPPKPRYWHAMAYDIARQRILLFGGYDGRDAFADTWEWDGNGWILRSPSSSPPKRSRHAMAYDVVRQRIVLFGGDGHPGILSDTWEWDGITWTKRSPVTSPSARSGHKMAYDIRRNRVILTGPGSGDTWEWDGTAWSLSQPANSPGGHMAYDAARQRAVVFDGSHTWIYGVHTPATTQPFGTPCSGPQPAPILCSTIPYLGNPAFSLDVIAGLASSVAVFGLSTATQTLSIPPCTLYLTLPLIALPAATNAAGFASISLALPLDSSLHGTTLYAQAFVADPQGPALGLTLTAGLKLMLGD